MLSTLTYTSNESAGSGAALALSDPTLPKNEWLGGWFISAGCSLFSGSLSSPVPSHPTTRPSRLFTGTGMRRLNRCCAAGARWRSKGRRNAPVYLVVFVVLRAAGCVPARARRASRPGSSASSRGSPQRDQRASRPADRLGRRCGRRTGLRGPIRADTTPSSVGCANSD